MPNWVSEGDVDEISTVDLPANQHGLFVLAKRAAAEETTVGDYFDAQGQPVDITELGVGDWFQDEQGNAYQWTDEQGGAVTADGTEVVFEYDGDGDDDVYDGLEQRELAEVGKSAFLQQVAKQGDDLFASLSKSLEEAIADESARTSIAKAISDMSGRLSKAEERARQAETLAKRAQDREEERVFIAKAATYQGLPVDADELGPVLHRMTKSMSYEDCLVIAKCLEHPGDIFKQYGIDGDPGSDDVFDQVEKYMAEHASDVMEEMGKRALPAGPASEGGQGRSVLSKEGAVTAFFNSNPREYSALKRGRR